jgi:hypothetical protein
LKEFLRERAPSTPPSTPSTECNDESEKSDSGS